MKQPWPDSTDTVSVRNVTRNEELGREVRLALGFWQRLRGLLGTAELEEHSGLLLAPCQSVHMWGMRYALDVIFGDRGGVVRGICRDLRPWQLSPFFSEAYFALELPIGQAQSTEVGDQLSFQEPACA